MAKNSDNARVFGDINSAVLVGPVGSTAPTSPTAAPDAAFVELGWMSEDGVSEARDLDSDEKGAWQGGSVIRTVRSKDSRTFKFVAMETKQLTVALTRPGSTPTSALGITTTPVKTYIGQDNKAWIIDTIDGAIHTRKVIAKGEVVDFGEIASSGQDITMYEFEVKCYPSATGVLYTEITDDPAMVVA